MILAGGIILGIALIGLISWAIVHSGKKDQELQDRQQEDLERWARERAERRIKKSRDRQINDRYRHFPVSKSYDNSENLRRRDDDIISSAPFLGSIGSSDDDSSRHSSHSHSSHDSDFSGGGGSFDGGGSSGGWDGGSSDSGSSSSGSD